MQRSEVNKRLNNEVQVIAEKILDGTATELERNRLATIIRQKLKFYISEKFSQKEEDIEDILHRAIVKIFKGIKTYKPQYRFTTWIYNITKNEALGFLSDKRKHTSSVNYETAIYFLESIEETFHKSTERETVLNELHKVTLDAMFSLEDPLERGIIIDKEINKLKGEEIARKYNLKINTIKTKLRKIRKTLKEKISKNRPDLVENIQIFLDEQT